jgi:E3 ubiquitin-protein ligase DOA10
VLNPDLQQEIPFRIRFKKGFNTFFKECILNWWTFLWLVLNVLSFGFFIACLALQPLKERKIY